MEQVLRKHPSACRAAIALIYSVVVVSSANGQATVPTDFTDQLVRGSLTLPTGLAFVPDAGSRAGRRLFVVEQNTARVRLLVDGALGAVDPCGVIANTTTVGGERGLLGIAVDPRWPAKPYVYVHHSSGTTMRIARYACTGDLAFTGNGAIALDDASRYELINDAPDINYNHGGGTLRFGSDSTLFASLGDDAISCSAQDTTSLRGVILRLEVRALPDGPGGPPAKSALVPLGNPFPTHPNSNARLVWAMGFRNPFRFHIDGTTGKLFVADVGEASREEVSMIPKGGNAGWPMYEGELPFITCSEAVSSGFTTPIYTYDHSAGPASVVSLGVYRRLGLGSGQFPADYEGDCFFADYYYGWIRRLSWNGAAWSLQTAPGQPSTTNWATGVGQISDALVAPDGSIWYVRQGVNYAVNTGQVRVIRFVGTVDSPGARSATLHFSPPQPNPSHGTTRFAFILPTASRVELALCDLSGRHVRTLVADALEAGSHDAVWDGRDDGGARLAPGLYFARLRVADAVRTQRVALAQ
ncbi:MAG: PQQ-dependent sugar dehydrogenase [Candidatus Eisenbacteria bacterium]